MRVRSYLPRQVRIEETIKPEQNRLALVLATARAQLAADHVLGRKITADNCTASRAEQATYQWAHMLNICPPCLVAAALDRVGPHQDTWASEPARCGP